MLTSAAVSCLVIALCSLFFTNLHQGLSQRSFPNPPHTIFDHNIQNYTRIDHLISREFESSNIDGPESIAISKIGDLYAAVSNGRVLHISIQSGQVSTIATLPGRGVGVALNREENGKYPFDNIIGSSANKDFRSICLRRCCGPSFYRFKVKVRGDPFGHQR